MECMKKTVSPDAPRRRLDPEARREQLLNHAISAFVEAGIERAGHADVATRAGVSTPTVFKYFPTRDALVKAVLDKVESTLLDLIRNIPENSSASPELLTRYWGESLTHMCQTKPDIVKVGLLWSVAFSSVKPRYLAFEDLVLDVVQSRLSAPHLDRSDARIMWANGMLFARMHFNDTPKDVRQMYQRRLSEIFKAPLSEPA